MRKELKIAVVVFLIVVAGILSAGLFYFVNMNTKEEEEAPEGAALDPDSEIQKLLDTDKDIEFDRSENEDGAPSEYEFSDDLHKMTHQKVKASEKWGHLEITEERIDKMLQTAKASDYEYKAFYIEALTAWQAGDFSNAVQVHNVIWRSQNGSVGIATELLTPQEEMEYKARYFE